MTLATRLDVEEVCGADQLCSGVKARIEAAIHNMRDIFLRDGTEGSLIVDASNAFNGLGQPAMLWKCRVLWPRCSQFLFNVERRFSVIILKGETLCSFKVLHNREGTPQGSW